MAADARFAASAFFISPSPAFLKDQKWFGVPLRAGVHARAKTLIPCWHCEEYGDKRTSGIYELEGSGKAAFTGSIADIARDRAAYAVLHLWLRASAGSISCALYCAASYRNILRKIEIMLRQTGAFGYLRALCIRGSWKPIPLPLAVCVVVSWRNIIHFSPPMANRRWR